MPAYTRPLRMARRADGACSHCSVSTLLAITGVPGFLRLAVRMDKLLFGWVCVALRELQAAVQARRAEQRCAELYRERAIARAKAAERDPTQQLN